KEHSMDSYSNIFYRNYSYDI
ncbi:hypothetical protein D047_5019B, partial [Vibrio parahaemolyticus VPTS-2010_2]